MKLNKILVGILAMSALVLAACSTDDDETAKNEKEFVEAPKCDGTVSVRILGDTRAASTIDPTIDRLTATRCDTENVGGKKYYLVSYHGRNKEEIGMLQIVDSKNGNVTDEIYFEDARLNYVQSCSNGCLYFGVDRKGSTDIEGKNNTLCGIVALKMNNQGKFVLPNGQTRDNIRPYKVNGLSVNCIKLQNNNALVVASAGNAGLDNLGPDHSKSGFTKFQTDKYDGTKLSVRVDNTDYNYRGYWVSYNDYTGPSGTSNYTYRKVSEDGKSLEFYAGVTDGNNVYCNNTNMFGKDKNLEFLVYTQTDSTNNYGRYASCTYFVDGKKYLIASTGTKEGGARVFYFDTAKKEYELVDVWHKACIMTSVQVYKDVNGIKFSDGKVYTYAACGGGGLYKLELQPEGDHGLRLIPVGKYVSPVLTESGTNASINYVQDVENKKLLVAAGYAGFMSIDYATFQFDPCDERTDFELE